MFQVHHRILCIRFHRNRVTLSRHRAGAVVLGNNLHVYPREKNEVSTDEGRCSTRSVVSAGISIRLIRELAKLNNGLKSRCIGPPGKMEIQVVMKSRSLSGLSASSGCLPRLRRGGKRLHSDAKGNIMVIQWSPDNNTPYEDSSEQELLHRFSVVEQSQREMLQILQMLQRDLRDVLFFLRSMHVAVHNRRAEISNETRRIHCEVIRIEPFNGRCPCCLETKVVSNDGDIIPPAQVDHFLGQVYSAPVHSWLICLSCHQELTNDHYLTWYRRIPQFRTYQAAVDAYTQIFGRRTPTRMYMPPRKI